MHKYQISQLFSHAAVPALVAAVITGQITHKHSAYHAKRNNVPPSAIQRAWEDSEDDGWYHRPISPGLHEEFGS